MSLHTDLEIYKTTRELGRAVVNAVKQMPRDGKPVLGYKLRDLCFEVAVLIFQANVARDKRPYLLAIIEQIQVINLILQYAWDLKYIPRKRYSDMTFLTTSISKQANG